MKPAIAFCVGMALGIGLAALTQAHAGEKLLGLFPPTLTAQVLPRPKPPVPGDTVNLHCIVLMGPKADIADWLASGDQFKVLEVCGQTFFEKASCEHYSALVNGLRPALEGRGSVGWKLFAAMCSEAQPVAAI